MIAVYIRVSTKEQNLESQRMEIQRWLTAHHIGNSDVRWFEDKQTGKDLKRPGFKAIQAAIFAGEVDTVVVWKLDRLARSFRDGMKIMINWLQQEVRLVSVTQQVDIEGILGQMYASLLFAIAELELKTSKERQAAGIAVAKVQGKYKGRKLGTTKAAPGRARELRANHLTVKEIAAAMGVSPRTAANYLKEKFEL